MKPERVVDIAIGVALILLLILLAGCDDSWDGVYRTASGDACVLDEYPDSETGVIETYCRLASEPEIPSCWERVREIHVLWEHASRLYPDRLSALMARGTRVIYANSPAALVPGNHMAVPWSQWTDTHGLPYTTTGFCCWASTTDDGLSWLVVSTYNFQTPLPILAHELAHGLFPELQHGVEFDAVIYSLLVGRTSLTSQVLQV
jgi:hypothetical protein